MPLTRAKPYEGEFGPHRSAAPGLWKGAAFVFPAASRGYKGRQGLLNRYGQPIAVTPTASGTLWRTTPYGLGLGNSNSADLRRLLYTGYAPITTSDGAGSGDFTMLSLCNPTPAATVAVALHQRLSGGSANQA